LFVFCDDALGVNIGFVLAEPGGGPGNLPLPEGFVWSKWNETNRFWQDPAWAADVNAVVWSPSGRYVYVSTDEIYGSSGLFRLDLMTRGSERLNVQRSKSAARVPKIVAVRPSENKLVVEWESRDKIETEFEVLEPKNEKKAPHNKPMQTDEP
jgi:hypothetical protein